MLCGSFPDIRFGAADTLKRAAFTALAALLALGVVISAAGVLLSGPLMSLLNAQSDIFSSAKAYLAIYSVGAMPMLIYNAASGVFTGLGDSKTPLLLLFVSSLLNVVLDYIAVKVLDWAWPEPHGRPRFHRSRYEKARLNDEMLTFFLFCG